MSKKFVLKGTYTKAQLREIGKLVKSLSPKPVKDNRVNIAIMLPMDVVAKMRLVAERARTDLNTVANVYLATELLRKSNE